MAWPTVAVSTTNLDAATDSPASARSDLLDAVGKLNQIIATHQNGRAAWFSGGNAKDVAGQIGWKRYGDFHTIFDASAGTTPGNTVCSDTNPYAPWQALYPTLMGWDGTYTYGVRVDTARHAENAIGVGQVWSSHAFSRAVNTTYTNSTGKSIMIAVTCDLTNSASYINSASIWVDSLRIGMEMAGNYTSPRVMCCAIVPPASTYRVEADTFTYWSELR